MAIELKQSKQSSPSKPMPVHQSGTFLVGKSKKKTKLASDVGFHPIITIKQPDETSEALKKWFFVNGIAGGLFWLRLACEKLATGTPGK